MKYSHPYVRLVAQWIPNLCAAYFAVFCFAFVLFTERDVLAQAQFQFSHGSTVYHPLISAFFCTLVLLLLGLLLDRVLNWLPLRMRAVAWFPSFLALGALTHWRLPLVSDGAEEASWWFLVPAILLWGLLLVFARIFFDTSKEHGTFPTYAWPNILILLIFTAISVDFANTNIRTHRLLASVRMAHEGNWEGVLRQAKYEKHPSRQQSLLTALALSRQDQLGEQLFAFPQPYGIDGLLPQEGDTLLFHSTLQMVGKQLRYLKTDRTTSDLFFEVADTLNVDSLHTLTPLRHYHLCALLLERRLDDFSQLLGRSYPSTPDSLLPAHYGQALALCARDSLPLPADYLRFDSLRRGLSPILRSQSANEREFQCRRAYGDTYWYYYFFGRK